jgi:hypothetical protein
MTRVPHPVMGAQVDRANFTTLGSRSGHPMMHEARVPQAKSSVRLVLSTHS